MGKIKLQWEEYRRGCFRAWDKEAEVWVVMRINEMWRVLSQGKNMKEAHKALNSAIDLRNRGDNHARP